MPHLKTLAIAVASALLAAYAALWFAVPRTVEAPHTVIRPPLKVEAEGEALLLWGAWDTREGYVAPGTNAVEIRCDKASRRCTEAYASILHHTEGEDLEAQVFSYQVQSWTDTELLAVADQAIGCLSRRLRVNLAAQQARLEWGPGAAGCEGDVGAAVLVGDPP